MTDGTNEPAAEPVAATDGLSPAFRALPVRGVAVRLPALELVLPDACACCGAPPTHRVRQGHVSGRVALVPYCSDCHRHVSREETRLFAISLSAVIVTFTLAVGLPLIWQPRLALLYSLGVLTGGLVPVVLGALWPRRRGSAHAVMGRAAVFRLDGWLACASRQWGEDLARKNGSESHGIRYRERLVPVGTLATLAVVCSALPIYYRLHFPSVRILNLTDSRLEIAVDGKHRCSVPPTSAESTGAGVEVRMAAGQRVLSATDGLGRVVDDITVAIRTGAEHLYAPASGAYCFWVETAGYGRSKGAGTQIQPLGGSGRFWALEDAIDLWFSPLPDADFDDRSTGGYLRAIRQAPCEAAPPSVRSAVKNGGAPPFATGVQ